MKDIDVITWIKFFGGTLLIILTIMFGVRLYGHFKEISELEEIVTYKIDSLETTQGTNGHWGLFSGKIDTVGYYWFYKINKDGSKSLIKIETEKTKIYEDADEEPYVEEIKKVYYTKGYKLHIPKNSIEKKYNPHITD